MLNVTQWRLMRMSEQQSRNKGLRIWQFHGAGLTCIWL